MSRPDLPDAVRAAARTLASTGRETWWVGESLATALGGRRPGAWSLLTTAPSAEIPGLFPRAVPIVPKDRTWQLPSDAGPIHLSSLPPGVGLESALAARALSLFALAWPVLGDAVIDPFDGAGALERGEVAATTEHVSLVDHPRAALDAARLCATHGYSLTANLEDQLAQLTRSDFERCAPALRGLAVRRLVAGPHAADAVALLARTGCELALGLRMRSDTVSLLAKAPDDEALRLGIWLRGSRPGRCLRRHRVHPELIDEVVDLLAAHPVESHYSARRRASLERLSRLPEARLEALFWLRENEVEHEPDPRVQAEVRSQLAALREGLIQFRGERAETRDLPRLAMDGRGVMQTLGVQAGPEVGRALAFLRQRVADDEGLNTRDTLRSLLNEWSRTRN